MCGITFIKNIDKIYTCMCIQAHLYLEDCEMRVYILLFLVS